MMPIPNHLGYFATRDGKIWSAKRQRFLKGQQEKNGRWTVHICMNGKPRKVLIHRLILLTFVGTCPAGLICCHNDGNPSNNNVNNLRWDSYSNNLKDDFNNGTRSHKGENSPASKLTEQNVRIIIYMYRTGLFTQQEIADVYGVCRENMGLIVRKINWNYIWSENESY